MLLEYMKSGEEKKVSNLVWNVFEEFEAPSYDKQEGIDEFKKNILPAKIKECVDTGKTFVICYKENDEIIGVISVRDNSHIALLFIKKEYHRRGIARQLFKVAIEKCCKIDSDLQVITVNSSVYAVGIYEKLGFVKTNCEQEKDGIRFTPMKFTVNS